MTQTPKSNTQNKKIFLYGNCLVAVLVIATVIGYLMQINSATQIGLTLQQLQAERDTLKETERDLQLNIAERQSISYIQERAAQLGMSYPSHISYIAATQPAAVAKR